MSAVHRFDRIPSTQREALAWARAGAPAGTVVIAGSQMEGVGRLDHLWASPPGGLYLSYLADAPSGPLSLLPLAVGSEMARRLAGAFGLRPRIRWPNDLWLERPSGKLAGILLDRLPGPSGDRVVIGVGVNVRPNREAFPAPLQAAVAILQERVRRPVELREVEGVVLESLDAAVQRIALPAAAEGIVAEVTEWLDGIGQEVEIDGVAAGRILGIDAEGALLTERSGARVRHLTGSLEYRPGPVAPE
jgi:BirA family biotin operon repressor/biotin-[acetyl-CoA-carboxylase] ligase